MCNPGIKQDYAVLRAFNDARQPIDASDLKSRVSKILSTIGYTELTDLAGRDLLGVLMDLDIGDYVVADEDGLYSITQSGKSMLSLLETYVVESTPELAA